MKTSHVVSNERCATCGGEERSDDMDFMISASRGAQKALELLHL
jgi:hypothetical protein